jgi:uncharacterized protein YjbI with pentapeptide repeats
MGSGLFAQSPDRINAIALEAYLRGADLSWANLQGADLSEANLLGVNLEGALYNNTIWPNGFTLP